MQMFASLDHDTSHLTAYTNTLNKKLNHILHHNDVEYNLQSHPLSPSSNNEDEDEDEDEDEEEG